MDRIEQSFNEYCNSNIHGSEERLREKVLARWAQREITALHAEVERLRAEVARLKAAVEWACGYWENKIFSDALRRKAGGGVGDGKDAE